MAFCKLDPKDFRFGSEHSSPGAVLVKPPGSINGQQFIIEDLTQCEVRVLDRSDCTQVDHCVDSEITLGPVDGSLFARDCKGCTFHVAARQFRMRDCTDCTVYLWVETEPVIEASSNIRFAVWDTAYPQLTSQFAALKLDPADNHFALEKKVFDFHKNDAAYPEPHCVLLPDTAPWAVRVLQCEGAGEPENPVPMRDGTLWETGGAAPAGPAAVPRRFALRYDPPAMVLEYEEGGEVLYATLDCKLRRDSSVPDVVSDLYSLFPKFITVRTVRSSQLERLVTKLKANAVWRD
eukprot:TRINITY_DN15509_c1_g1_i1.p1 TRINITY_DN15509_c1_g1~~TRINITY_DN15509_c1_g1_i1.p1  ORF type:complete len:301 (-),score=123.74 TRINITY_DN15509_c1_g1_i1:75-950(-)